MLISYLMVVLDISIVITALPEIHAHPRLTTGVSGPAGERPARTAPIS